MSDVRPIPNNRQYVDLIHRAADRTGVRTEKIDAHLDDPSLVETRKAQQQRVQSNPQSLVKDGVLELVANTGTALGFAAGAAAPFTMLGELSRRIVEAHDQGAALANARARDAMQLAVLNLASGALPEGFVQLNAHLLRESAQGASRILTHLHGTNQYAELKATSEAFVKRGLELATKYGVVDRASLARARQAPAFEADYRNNPALRLGVEAAIYLHHQAEVEKQ